MSGPSGLTTEAFVDQVAWRLGLYLAGETEPPVVEEEEQIKPDPSFRRNYNVDKNAVKEMFDKYDTDSSGMISLKEFEVMLVKLGIAPQLQAQSKTKVDETEIVA